MHDKPPVFLWLVVLMSFLVDGATAPVSVAACRLPGLLATLATMVYLDRRHRGAPPAFALGWLPAFGAGAVLLDPLLMAALTPWAVHNPRSGKPTHPVVLAISVAAGLAVKGLVGALLPALALGIYGVLVVWENRRRGQWLAQAKTLLAHEGLAWVLGTVLGMGFFGLVYVQPGGQAFVRDFFWVHHFQRGSQAFEGHGGGPWYHPLVFLVGGGPLALFALRALLHEKVWKKDTFPLIWCLVTVGFFSAMATKLPNYIWPIWPAVALFGAGAPPARPRALGWACLWPLPLGVALLALPPLLPSLLPLLPLDPRAMALAHEILPLPFTALVGLGSLGFGLVAQGLMLKGGLGLAWGALPLGLGLILFSVTMGPIIKRHTHEPIAYLAAKAGNRTMATLGMRSPTVSLIYGRPLEQHSKGNTTVFKTAQAVLTPFWLQHRCQEHGFEAVEKKGYLVLCLPANPPLAP